MEVCFLMAEKHFWGFVTIVTLGPYSVNRVTGQFLRLIGANIPEDLKYGITVWVVVFSINKFLSLIGPNYPVSGCDPIKLNLL